MMASERDAVPPQGKTILIIEDEAALVAALAYNLRREGFVVASAGDGVEGLRLARAERPSLVILDLMLPGMDGIDVCRRLRSQSTVPILILTAKSDEVDKVVGLEVGADDYMTKPFSVRELLARVRAMLRRVEMEHEESVPDVVDAAGLHLDMRGREAVKDGRELSLKPKEFDLVAFLARHPRQVFSREQLLDEVWGFEFAGMSRTVDVHVRWLRQKIEDDPGRPAHLLTVRGSGYKFVP
jgi:two-component system OmpR family response regulator